MWTDRTLAGFCLAAVGLLAAAYLWEFHGVSPQLDDAFISYRYALNLVSGHGLVFNVDERVEGYTNLLWTLLVAAGMWLGGDGPGVGHLLSEVFGAASLVAIYLYTRHLLPPHLAWRAVLAPAALYASNAFVKWTTAGLETPLFLFLVISIALAAARGRRWVMVALCILATLTRPDGVLVAAVFLGADVWQRWSEAAWRPGQAPRILAPMTVFGVSLLLLTAWRWFYYGDLLPNTFYAKVGGVPISTGMLYLVNFLRDGPVFLLPGTLLAVSRVPAFRPGAGLIYLVMAYVVAIGGDVFTCGRFLLPILPMFIAGAIAGSTTIAPRRALLRWALAIAVPLNAIWSLYGYWPDAWGLVDPDFRAAAAPQFPVLVKRAAAANQNLFGNDQENAMRDIAQLRMISLPARLVATVAIGRLGYYAPDLRLLDLVGLVDRHIAYSHRVMARSVLWPGHQRTDSDYVLARRPDVILIPQKGSQLWDLPTFLDLWNNPNLDRYYRYDTDIHGYVLRS